MTSAINPNNIDGTYPVAGQDNNSQGFRDNFTNTKTNFQYAADEISDLQNKVILKAALTGETLNNNMLGSLLSNAQLADMSATVVPLGTPGTTTVTIDYTAGHYQSFTTAGARTIALTNFPAAGQLGLVIVEVTVANASHTLTLPNSVSVNAVGIQGYNPSTYTITFAASGVYTFQFTTTNNGSVITVNEVNNLLQPLNNTSESLAAGAAVSLATTTSYFTTTAIETTTLAAGVPGQIKVLSAVDVTHGNMITTVTNAGWKATGTGTITFTSRGSGCTLQYTNSKWYCIGNNGCSFA